MASDPSPSISLLNNSSVLTTSPLTVSSLPFPPVSPAGMPASFHMNILEEMIPHSYLQLQQYITELVESDPAKGENCVILKTKFW